MAEKIISPGVFTKEIDQTYLPAAIGEIGAAIVGPTVKGPAGIPTVVNSYSQFQAIFGDTFKSGSDYFQYLTSHTAREYLKSGPSMLVTRILPSGHSKASSQVSSSTVQTSGNTATGSLVFKKVAPNLAITIKDTTFTVLDPGAVSMSLFPNTTTQFWIASSSLATDATAGISASINTLAYRFANALASSSLNISASVQASGSTNDVKIYLTSSLAGTGANVTGSTNDGTQAYFAFGGGPDVVTAAQGRSYVLSGGTTDSATGISFKLHTIGDGTVANSTSKNSTNNIIPSGSKDNIRWEVSQKNNTKGTFTLLVRRGDDTIKRKQIMETWNNVSLDPKQNNYIAKIIGDSVWQMNDAGSANPFIAMSGSYMNKSKYVRVEVIKQTVDYLDENGNLRITELSSSLPSLGSGSFAGGSDGGANFTHPQKFYDNITNTNNQGLNLGTAAKGKTAYEDALNLLKNQDEYDFNLLLLPGIVDFHSNHTPIVTKAIDVCEGRGDCFVVYDAVPKGASITTTTSQAGTRDSNYAATYYPWIQTPDLELGTNRWVPPSVVIPGVYAFNDKVAHPWFAPAGLNRGGIDTAIQADRKLTHSNRDDLYSSNVNPIATFPGQGVVVWGQKTLQKKASALDRVNVRRLMIKVKKFIAASSRFLVFEQNNSSTRRRFLNIVNPYLEQVQSNSGLNAFRVVMDESNNTPDVVDRNILYGQLFLQPTRTAEFVVLDFTIQPTGATFPE